MAGNPFYQDLDPAGAPDPVTPADGPGDPAGFAMVTPPGRGTAAYDVQAADITGEVAAAFDGASSLAGPGGPRQAQIQTLMDSPQGFSAGGGTSGFDVTAGYSGGGGDSWPNDVQPGILETPDQGTGTDPGTGTD